MIHPLAALTLAAFAMAPVPGAAQTSTTPPLEDPWAAQLPYRSAFEGYQAFSEEKLAPWKESNETVRQVGGWREYSRRARDPQLKPEAAPRGATAGPQAGEVKP